MDINETIKCLQILLDCVVLNKGNPNFTLLDDVKPSSFDWVIKEAIYHLESIDDK